MPSPFQVKTLYDALGAFSGGTNEGDVPLDLPPNVMAGAINTTVRGKFVTHRPSFWKRPITYVNGPPVSVPQPPIQFPTPAQQNIILSSGFTVPAVNNTVTINVSTEYQGNQQDVVRIGSDPSFPLPLNFGNFKIVSFTPSTITITTVSSGFTGDFVGGSGTLLVFYLVSLGPGTPQPPIQVPGTTAAQTQSAVQYGYFQGAQQGTDDAGNASLIAMISQRLFQFLIIGNVIKCAEVLIPGGPSQGIQPQAWIWQAERWIIVTDGKNAPIFVDLNGGVSVTPVSGNPVFGIASRSNSGTQSNFSTTTASGFAITSASSTSTTTGSPSNNQTQGTTDTDGGVTTYNLYQYINTETVTETFATGESVGIPSIGGVNTLNLSSTTNLRLSDVVTIQGVGQFSVQDINGLTVTLLNLNATTAGANFGTGLQVTWSHIGQQMPASCMGAYGNGRNWIALPGQINFIAGDIVGGASGTAAYNFRDAVLNVTENNFIVGGGSFRIPASGSEMIQAFMFLATLDASLGQGPLQVFTNRRVFSCNAPVDRLTWQSLTNPILTVSLIGDGAQGQNSTIMVKSDPIFRSTNGISSLTFETVQFEDLNNLWINSPLSFEVSPIIIQDNQALLQWGSAIDFDNRALVTCTPFQGTQGVYFTGMVVINFDTASTLKKKSNPVWDSGVWTGMNVLQLTSGEVANMARAFSFCLNTSSPSAGIEVYEILQSSGPNSSTTDFNGTANVPITWQFDSASLRFGIPNNNHVYMQLKNGEITVDKMIGSVDFEVLYLPDQFPCWTSWRKWTSTSNITCPPTPPAPNTTPQNFAACNQVFFGEGPPGFAPAVSVAVYFDITNPAQPKVYYWQNNVWTDFIG